MIMCLQSLVSFCQFVLKIWSKNQILTSIKGRNRVRVGGRVGGGVVRVDVNAMLGVNKELKFLGKFTKKIFGGEGGGGGGGGSGWMDVNEELKLL